MSTPTEKTAGPDYWFVDPDRVPDVDYLAEDECPLDEIEEARWIEEQAAAASLEHFRTCALGIGPHLAEECPR